MTMDDSTKEILKTAREIVNNGWVQGYAMFNDAYCARGGITYAAAKLGYKDNEFRNEVDKAERKFGCAIGSLAIAMWNDEPGRTKEHVLAAFDKAIRGAAK